MNLTEIMSDTRFIVFGDSSNTQYSDTDIKRNINKWYKTGIVWVMASNGDWQVLGDKAYTDFVAGQSNYALPEDIMKLNEVYVKINSEYIKAIQRDPANINDYLDSNYYPTTPEFDLIGNQIYIYLPTAIETTTAGLRVHYQTEVTELSSGTDTPVLSDPFRKLLSYGSALEYCVANEMWNKAKKLEETIYQSIKTDLQEYYANRSTARPLQLTPKTENYN